MRPVLGIAALLLLPLPAFGQAGLQAGDGSGSFLLPKGGLLQINFSEKSVQFGYTFGRTASAMRYGGRVKVTATDGVAAIFEEGEGLTLPEAQAAAHLGWLWQPGWPLVADFALFFNGAYSRGTFSLAAIASDSTVTVHDTVFNGLTGAVHLNSLVGKLAFMDVGWGLAASWGARNNYRGIAKRQVCDVLRSAAMSGERELASCTSARDGDAYQVIDAWQLSLDLVLWQPWSAKLLGDKLALGLDGIVRYDEVRPQDDWSYGLVVFVTPKNSPRMPYGALTLQWFGGDLRIGMQGGLPFGLP